MAWSETRYWIRTGVLFAFSTATTEQCHNINVYETIAKVEQIRRNKESYECDGNLHL